MPMRRASETSDKPITINNEDLYSCGDQSEEGCNPYKIERQNSLASFTSEQENLD